MKQFYKIENEHINTVSLNTIIFNSDAFEHVGQIYWIISFMLEQNFQLPENVY